MRDDGEDVARHEKIFHMTRRRRHGRARRQARVLQRPRHSARRAEEENGGKIAREGDASGTPSYDRNAGPCRRLPARALLFFEVSRRC